jgi:hypothetical protein
MRKIKLKFRSDNEVVSLRSWIVLGDHFTDKDGDHLLSPECVSVKEVEYYVKARKAELDAVLVKAQKQFKKSSGTTNQIRQSLQAGKGNYNGRKL